jgi:cobalt/nickel transport system permease protein
MHIPDGMLDTKTWVSTWAISGGFIGYAVRWTRDRLSQQRIVLMAVMSALVFALQMLNFPVAGGTTGHFAGGAACAIILGPWPAVLVLSAVLGVQALLFADGGITAFGANALNMAIIAPFVGFAVYRLALRIRNTRGGMLVGAFVAAWAAVVAASLGAALELWLSGRANLLLVGGALGAWHAIIGVGEGLVTVGIVAYLSAVRPDLLAEGERDASGSTGGVAVVLGIVALAAAGVSFLAATNPDGLEYVAAGQGFAVEGADLFASPLPDYVIPGVANERLAGVLAGIVGVVVTGALIFAALTALGRRTPAKPTRGAHDDSGVHGHVHEHDDVEHRHPHHHTGAAAHEHAHPTSFEAYSYLVSPIHDLDPRAKLVAAFVVVLGVVVSPPMRAAEFALTAALLVALTLLSRVPLRAVLGRSALVLPVAATIALFAPLQALGAPGVSSVAEAYSTGWVVSWSIVSKAWLAAYTLILLAATTPAPRLFAALRAARMPTVVLTLLSFVFRYLETLRDQLRSLRRALVSRGGGLRGRRLVRTYGNVAGNLVVRSYDRGERVYAAMLSRGYDGTLPSAEPLRATNVDFACVAAAVLVAFALVLY